MLQSLLKTGGFDFKSFNSLKSLFANSIVIIPNCLFPVTLNFKYSSIRITFGLFPCFARRCPNKMNAESLLKYEKSATARQMGLPEGLIVFK